MRLCLQNQQNSEYLNEEFDIEGELGNYEKINVPTFGGGRHSQFIHDFNAVCQYTSLDTLT